MDEIVIRRGVRSQLEELTGNRTRALLCAFVIAALVVGAAAFARLRQPPAAVAPPATSATAPSAKAPQRPRVFVHVAGAVVDPGLYRLTEGTRVADAIDAAGGALPRADLDAINLAEVVADGLKVVVPRRGSPPVVVSSTTSASPGPVNLNVADQAALETIPGVGPVTATAILQHRTEIGGFETVEQLLDVTGIGPATLEALRPYVTV